MRARRFDPAITAKLGISRKTASNHVAAILRKLGAETRKAAGRLVAREHLVGSDEPHQTREDTMNDARTAWALDFVAREGFDNFFGADLPRRCDEIAAEHPELQAILATLSNSGSAADELRLAGRLGTFWTIRGHLALGRTALERALTRQDAAPAAVAGYAWLYLSLIALYQGDFTASRTASANAQRYAATIDNAPLLASIRNVEQFHAVVDGDLDRAIAIAADGVAQARRVQHPGLEAHNLLEIARCHALAGNAAAAEPLLDGLSRTSPIPPTLRVASAMSAPSKPSPRVTRAGRSPN